MTVIESHWNNCIIMLCVAVNLGGMKMRHWGRYDKNMQRWYKVRIPEWGSGKTWHDQCWKAMWERNKKQERPAIAEEGLGKTAILQPTRVDEILEIREGFNGKATVCMRVGEFDVIAVVGEDCEVKCIASMYVHVCEVRGIGGILSSWLFWLVYAERTSRSPAKAIGVLSLLVFDNAC